MAPLLPGGSRDPYHVFHDRPSLSDRVRRSLPRRVEIMLGSGGREEYSAKSPRVKSSAPRWSLRRLLILPHALILLWLLLLYWGERSVFNASVQRCDWDWEDWPSEATPHRLIFVADPQLVDPHTYPGRPWPISSLTVHYTDRYLRRSYSLVQKYLQPDSVFFLGDLFDGGREWDSGDNTGSGSRWKKYGKKFWLREYDRFGRIFLGRWGRDEGSTHSPTRGGKIVASLPGNHDLGFGTGIHLSVRERFGAYFGDGSRVDVVGNHTIVSVDTVSLSAMGQADLKDGSQGSGNRQDALSDAEKIWRPVQSFLDNVKALKEKAVARELNIFNPKPASGKLVHSALEMNSPSVVDRPEKSLTPHEDASDFPTILLTHVPLYRLPGTPCGPLRERYPPSKPAKDQDGPLEKDERNAIAVARGYQYQNVLTPEVSSDLVEKVGNVAHVFSGDDHDYCEVLHKRYTTPQPASATGVGGIREITVKSMSFAMGVRHPGFQMVSLWNPVSESGKTLDPATGRPTIQTHLCLLPDQLAIFIRYALFFALTLSALFIRACMVPCGVKPLFQHPSHPSHPSSTTTNTILPTANTKHRSSPNPAAHGTTSSRPNTPADTVKGSGLSTSQPGGLAPRATSARTRSASPGAGYAFPSSQPASTATDVAGGLGIDFGAVGGDEKYRPSTSSGAWTDDRARRRGAAGVVLHEWGWGVWRVAWVVLGCYFWLLRY